MNTSVNDALQRVYQAVTQSHDDVPVVKTSLDRQQQQPHDNADDDEIETLLTVSRKVGRPVEEIRRLNPHVAHFDEFEPLPPGLKLSFKKNKDKSPANVPPIPLSVALAGGANNNNVDSKSSQRPSGGAPQSLAELIRSKTPPASESRDSYTSSGFAAPPPPPPAPPLIQASVDSGSDRREYRHGPVGNSGGLTIRMIGAKLRMTKGEILDQAPFLESFALDDHIPDSVLIGRKVGGVLLTTLLSGQSSLSAPTTAGSTAPLFSNDYRDREADAYKHPNRFASLSSPPPPPSEHAGTSSRMQREIRSPMSPPSFNERSSPNAGGSRRQSPVLGRSASSCEQERQQRRVVAREHNPIVRRNIQHQILISPPPQDGEPRLTIRRIARKVACCDIDDILDLNPELENIFGVDDPIPEGTIVCVPPNCVVPQNMKSRNYLDMESPNVKPWGEESSAASRPGETLEYKEPLKIRFQPAQKDRQDFVDLGRPSKPSSVASSAVVGNTRPLSGVPPSTSDFVRPSDNVGRTISEIAWSLGLSVEDLRNANTALDRFASHEKLPPDVTINIPLGDPQGAALDWRALEQRRTHSLQGPSIGAHVNHPQGKYQRLTSRSPQSSRASSFRGAAVPSQPAPTIGNASSSLRLEGLRTASNSVTAGQSDTNIRTFVITNPSLSVDLIARRLGIHPDTVYDLNSNELVDGPEGVYHFQEPLPLGMLLHLPA